MPFMLIFPLFSFFFFYKKLRASCGLMKLSRIARVFISSHFRCLLVFTKIIISLRLSFCACLWRFSHWLEIKLQNAKWNNKGIEEDFYRSFFFSKGWCFIPWVKQKSSKFFKNITWSWDSVLILFSLAHSGA